MMGLTLLLLIPNKDRDIHLVEFKFCSDINPQQTFKKRTTDINLLSSVYKEPPRNLEITVSLHVILLGVGGTIFNLYTITPLLNLGIPMHKVHQLATKLHCLAIKSSNKITKTRHKMHLNKSNSDNGGFGRGDSGRAVGFRRARRMADNPPDPH
jgi:hypothetical protein